MFLSLWDVMSVEEAVAEVRSINDPVIAAKRLQDLAQSYGCEDNISVIILRFTDFGLDADLMNKEETKYALKTSSNKVSLIIDRYLSAT